MSLIHNKVKKINFIAIVTFLCIFFVVNITKANPEFDKQNSDTITIGVRKTARKIDAFCNVFRDEFGKNQSKKIDYVLVGLQYSDRFRGLINGNIDIECGPNAKESDQLLDAKDNISLSKKITFSNTFYVSGIKLLLKRNIAEELSNSLNPEEFDKKLKNIPIVVVEQTSTYLKLNKLKAEDNTHYYSIHPVKAKKGENAREQALDALEKGNLKGTKIQAFASDSVIVQALFEEGLDEQGRKDQKNYQRKRDRYKDRGYVVFPSTKFPSRVKDNSNGYLPYLDSNNLAIAIRKEDEGKWLNDINTVLKDLKDPKSALAEARNEIEKFDKGESTPPTPTQNTTIKGGDPPKKIEWYQNPNVIGGIITAIIGGIITAIIGPIILEHTRHRMSQNDNPRSRPTLTGCVMDARTGEWIRQARVRLETNGIPQTKFTDAEGIFNFSFQNTNNCDIRIHVDADGYERFERLMPTSATNELQQIRLNRSNSL